MRMPESDPSEFQTWDNDPQASVLDRAENMSLLIISNGYIQQWLTSPFISLSLKKLYVLILNNRKYSIYLEKVDSRTLAGMPKVQMNLDYTIVIRG